MATNRNEMLLKKHRDAGFNLMEMQDQLLLFTERTRAHGRFVGSFSRMGDESHPELAGGTVRGWPIRAIWAVCDFEMGLLPIDYDKIDITDEALMDKIEHGAYSPPEADMMLPIAKGRLAKGGG